MAKKSSETRQRIQEIYEENELAALEQTKTRGRSIMVGNAGGGIIEICIRGDYTTLWHQLPPTEVVELIGQLAAASGIEIAMRPKNDFSTWRSWDPTLPASVVWMGASPHQLSDDDKALLTSSKEKNIKPIEQDNNDDDNESKSE